MKEINLPYTGIADTDKVEVTVRNCTNNEEWQYRIESLEANKESIDERIKDRRIERLINYINTYENGWELLNIIKDEKPGGCIHLLYRKQKSKI